MRRTQSLEFSGVYYIRIPPRCGRKSKKIGQRFATLPLLPWKWNPRPLHHTATTWKNLTPKNEHAVNFSEAPSEKRHPSARPAECLPLPLPSLTPTPVSTLFPYTTLFRSEGAIPCRSSGEAVGCPVRTTKRRCAHKIGRAHV